MAAGDTELGVRVSVIQVLEAIDGHSLLEDDEREKLCLLVFDEEPKVRKAVSGFVRGVWEESVEERLAGKTAKEKDKTSASMKSLAMLFVKWGKVLENIPGGDGEEDDSVDAGERGVTAVPSGGSSLTEVARSQNKGRTALAVEALWDDVDAVRDWDGLLGVLLLDHSTPQGTRSRAKGKAAVKDSEVDEAWRLTEEEETVLLEVFVATIQYAKSEAANVKKVRIGTNAYDHLLY